MFSVFWQSAVYAVGSVNMEFFLCQIVGSVTLERELSIYRLCGFQSYGYTA